MEIELYYTPHTRSLRPRWLLEELEIPYTIHAIDLFGGERNPAHPLGSVPAMTVNGQTMFESGAMCHWLADRFPETGLAPTVGAVLRPAYDNGCSLYPAHWNHHRLKFSCIPASSRRKTGYLSLSATRKSVTNAYCTCWHNNSTMMVLYSAQHLPAQTS